ncbi:hypothetical protein ABTZ59_12375 [Streptomyces sp. NPDC094034]|uniref:hypothetical protein n=1 Tax=Streptomyces sp. NPDC094034 TaxID=3155309 RepID=UPI00331C2D06
MPDEKSPAQEKRDRERERAAALRADPKIRQKHNDDERKRLAKKREDPAYRAAENERRKKKDKKPSREKKSLLNADRRSAVPEHVARWTYEDYRRHQPGWPEVPPPGLKIAVAAESAGLKIIKAPRLVSLNAAQQEAGPSGSLVPPFLADPSLDLNDSKVQDTIKKQGVDDQAYKTAQDWQTALQDSMLIDEFGADAALDTGSFADSTQGYADAGPAQEPDQFGYLYSDSWTTVDEFGADAALDTDSFTDSTQGYADAGPAQEPDQFGYLYSDSWTTAVNPVASHPLGLLPAQGTLQSQAHGMGGASWPIETQTVESFLPFDTQGARARGHLPEQPVGEAAGRPQPPRGQAPQGNTRRGATR